MIGHSPSRTAERVALRRAAHQILDEPKVFDDPLALRILGLNREAALEEQPEWLDNGTLSRVLRASLAARSRYAEDELHRAGARGIRQYVILGAGLDTFAYRNPYPADTLRVFEADHPATQAWKRECLAQAGIAVPASLIFVATDFEARPLAETLTGAGFDPTAGACIAWLGVTPYLTESAIFTTLRFAASLEAGSSIVFDYMISPDLLSTAARHAFNGLAERVAAAGEPFRSFFEPAVLAKTLLDLGFNQVDDVTPRDMDTRYFAGRTDGLRVGRLAHVMNART